MRETMRDPLAWRWAEFGSVPCSPLGTLGREEAVKGADAAGELFLRPVPTALALLPCPRGSGTTSRKETVGSSWSRAGSCLSGRTFQKVE